MRRLLLLRHTKSSWAMPGQADFDRPLAPRGLKAARRIARHMADLGLFPDAVICSPARRTRATLEHVLDGLPAPGSVRFERTLYDDGVDQLIAAVRATDDGHECVLVVGHNPTLQDAVLALTGDDGGAGWRREIAIKYPTGALATVEFAVDRWADIAPGGGTLRGYAKPRDL